MSVTSPKTAAGGNRYTALIGIASNTLNIFSFFIEKGPSVIAVFAAFAFFIGVYNQKIENKSLATPRQQDEFAPPKAIIKLDPEKICSDLLPFNVVNDFGEQMKFMDRCVSDRNNN